MRPRISISGCVRLSIRPSVRPSVRSSIRPSVRPSVGPLRLLKNRREAHLMASIGSYFYVALSFCHIAQGKIHPNELWAAMQTTANTGH